MLSKMRGFSVREIPARQLIGPAGCNRSNQAGEIGMVCPECHCHAHIDTLIHGSRQRLDDPPSVIGHSVAEAAKEGLIRGPAR